MGSAGIDVLQAVKVRNIQDSLVNELSLFIVSIFIFATMYIDAPNN